MKKMILAVTATACMTVFAGCGSDSDSAAGGMFLENAKLALPSITGTVATLQLRDRRSVATEFPTAFSAGNPIYQMYEMLKDFPHTVGEDMSVGQGFPDSNIYKAAWIADGHFNEIKSVCAPITENAITSPFEFGLTDTYNCASAWITHENGGAQGAIKEAADANYGLLTWNIVSDTTNQLSVIQGSMNDTTKQLKLHYTSFLDLAGTTDPGTHFMVDGNTETHTFFTKLYTYSAAEKMSMIGYGVSRGEGNYYLFKIRRDGTTAIGEEKYYCISATATATELAALDPNADGKTAAQIDTGNCADHRTHVDASGVSFYWYTDTTNDAPTAAASFNVGNAKAGTVQLDGV